MKKIVAFVVIMSMLICNMTSFAAGNKKMEEVLKSVKERVGDTDIFDEFNSSESEYDGEIRYEFSWRTSDEEDYRYMELAAGENGLIYNYHYFDNSDRTNQSKLSINTMASEDAMLRAEELMNTLNPQLAGKLLLEITSVAESLYGGEYGFNIIHVENGYEIYGDNGYISYNADTDRITSFYINYTENPDCQPADNAVSVDEAQKSYMENFGIRLYYMSKKGEDGKRVYIPVYAPVQKPNMYINANTNQVEEILVPESGVSGGGGATNEKAMMMSATADSAENRLTEAESAELESLGGLLSKDELIQIAKSNKFISVPSDFILSSYRLSGGDSYNGDADKYFASIEFSNKSEETYSWISFRLDAKTGEVISCSRYGDTDKNGELDETKARKLAQEVAKALSGEKFAEYKADEEGKDTKGRYTYTRYVNDIPVDNDKITVMIGNDNKLSSYRISYSYNEFEPLDGIISEEEAGKALFGAVDYIIVYMPQRSHENAEKYDIYVPVYVFDEGEPMIIDARSGKQLNYSGEEYVPQSIAAYNDIDGHYAEEAILSLAKHGISFEGESFRPDEKINQEDFMKLINSAFGNNGAEPYPIAKRRGIIKAEEIKSDAEVSREMAAVFLIRGMGAEEYASLEGIFIKPFEDVTTNIGAISILKGMGVLSGDGTGKFNPSETITRADSAMLIYKYLAR